MQYEMQEFIKKSTISCIQLYHNHEKTICIKKEEEILGGKKVLLHMQYSKVFESHATCLKRIKIHHRLELYRMRSGRKAVSALPGSPQGGR